MARCHQGFFICEGDGKPGPNRGVNGAEGGNADGGGDDQLSPTADGGGMESFRSGPHFGQWMDATLDQQGAQAGQVGGIADGDQRGAEAGGLVGKERKIGPGGESRDNKPPWKRGDDIQDVAADGAGRSQQSQPAGQGSTLRAGNERRG